MPAASGDNQRHRWKQTDTLNRLTVIETHCNLTGSHIQHIDLIVVAARAKNVRIVWCTLAGANIV